MAVKKSDILNLCPHCTSPNTVYKEKAKEWECYECERRFKRLSNKARRPKKIFFSYGHDEHKELVVMFKNGLELRGHTVWFDENRIGIWDDWKEKITRGIHDSQMAIAYMSKYSLRVPGVCHNEIAMALSRFGVVYPVKVEEGIDDDVPVTIRNLQWPDLSDWQEIKAGRIAGEWERWYEARLIELVDKIENEASAFAWEAEALRKILQPVAFESHFARYLEGFVGRDWIMDAYHDWVNHQPGSRVFWIKALPGFGKTTLAVNLAARERATVVSRWFCDWKSEELRDPKAAIRTMVFQLAVHCDSSREQNNDKPLIDYRRQLLSKLGINSQTPESDFKNVVKKLNNYTTYDLIRILINEPLAGLIEREHKLVILIDALDEATDNNGNNPLIDFLITHLGSLPKWVSFVVTSRPESVVSTGLQGFKPFVIDAENPRNIGDLRAWYAVNLAQNEELKKLQMKEQRRLEDLLIERSEGMFLFLTEIAGGLREGVLTVADLESMPSGVPGLNALYNVKFKHDFGQGFSDAVDIKALIRLLVVAPSSLPEMLACELLGWDEEKLNNARLKLGSYIIESGDGLKLFHKTLADWLTNKKDNHFWVNVKPARKCIADALFSELEKEQDMQRWSSLAVNWLHYWRAEQLTQWREPKALNILGCALNSSVEIHKSASFYHKRALEILKKQHSSGIHADIAKTLYYLGGTVSEFDSYAVRDEAIEFYKQALTMQEQLYSDVNLDIAKTLYRLGTLSLDAYEDTHPDMCLSNPLTNHYDNPHNVINSVSSRLRAQRDKKLHEAINYLERALAISEQLDFDDAYSVMTSILNRLIDFFRGQDSAESKRKLVSYCECSLSIQEQLHPDGIHSDIASALNRLAVGLDLAGNVENVQEIIRCYERSVWIQEQLHPNGVHPEIALSINRLASYLEKLGVHENKKKIVNCYERSLSIQEKLLPHDGEVTIKTLNGLANYLLKCDELGDKHQAVGYLKHALVLALQLYASNSYSDTIEQDFSFNCIASALNNLGKAWSSLGCSESICSAIEYYEHALEIEENIDTYQIDYIKKYYDLGCHWYSLNSNESISEAIYYWTHAVERCISEGDVERANKLLLTVKAQGADIQCSNCEELSYVDIQKNNELQSFIDDQSWSDEFIEWPEGSDDRETKIKELFERIKTLALRK